MPAWPGSLPTEPLVKGYQEGREDTKIRSPMDYGPAKVRRRTTAAVTKFVAGFILDDTDLATFETFYITTLNDGSLSFTWTHPRTGAAITVRFVKSYSIEAVGNSLYKAAAEMEILP